MRMLVGYRAPETQEIPINYQALEWITGRGNLESQLQMFNSFLTTLKFDYETNMKDRICVALLNIHILIFSISI